MTKFPKHMPDPLEVGLRLDALRAATDLPKNVFAEACSIDPSSYSKIITGKKPLKADMAFAASKHWGVSMDYFFHGSLDKLPEKYAKAIIASLTGKKR